tara:strand:- start:15078 stop:16073 length:996 start_codon:yes stop_codon:yes gene_type:complete
MPISIRPADTRDIRAMIPLLLQDAAAREARNNQLWAVDPQAAARLDATLTATLQNETPAFRQHWLIAEDAGRVVGLAHSILLPVPPIYAGEFGPPGLIMEDCCIAPGAPDGTLAVLVQAAQDDLVAAGARVVIGASVPDGVFAAEYTARGYEPLTLYLTKSDLRRAAPQSDMRAAQAADVPQIVAASARHRQIIADLDDFWTTHPDADARFGSWMHKSLTLQDRDMVVAEAEGQLEGYAIAQPASALHIPPAHDPAKIGFIDDYYHDDYADPAVLEPDSAGASGLLAAAEGASAARGDVAALVVCPAAWDSKVALLARNGYSVAQTWFIRR